MPFFKRYLLHHYRTVSANLLTLVVCKNHGYIQSWTNKKNKKKQNYGLLCLALQNRWRLGGLREKQYGGVCVKLTELEVDL